MTSKLGVCLQADYGFRIPYLVAICHVCCYRYHLNIDVTT